MGLKLVTLFSFIHFLLISSSQPNLVYSHGKKSSSLVFLNHLQGCKKGDKVEGIHKLKKYLQNFGYLNNMQFQTHSGFNDDDEFDDVLDSAIQTYQKNYNLKVTGTLDAKTLAQMSKPRCGVVDVIDGKTWMRSGKKRNENHTQENHHFHTVSHFAFFEGNLKWPVTKSHLTYGFLPGTSSEAISAVGRAFASWASNTHFTFSQASTNQSVDIKISFERGDHGDGHPFDSVVRVLAHAFPPTDGRFHFNADEPWAVGAVSNSFDIETVALHEIGHLLGLHHSSIEGAIMWPSIQGGATKGLHADDIAGIKALYNNTS